MTTNKPEVRRYDDTGCPEQICRVDTMHEMDDGDYVLYEDYEALKAEIEALRRDAARYRWLSNQATQQADARGPIFRIDVRRNMEDRTLFNVDAAIDAAIAQQEPSHDNQ